MTQPDDPPPPAPTNPLIPSSDDLDVDLEAYLRWLLGRPYSGARAVAACRRALFAERTLADHVALYTETALRLRGVEDERDKLLAERDALVAELRDYKAAASVEARLVDEFGEAASALADERDALAARIEELEAGHGAEGR